MIKKINALKEEQPKKKRSKAQPKANIKAPRNPDFMKRIRKYVKKRERQRLREEAKKAEKARKQAEREKARQEKAARIKEEKETFKEYVKEANAVLKGIKKEVNAGAQDVRHALGAIKGVRITKGGKISVSSDRKSVLMKQTINETLENKEAFLKALEKSKYSEFQRFTDVGYDIDEINKIIEGTKGDSLSTDQIFMIYADSDWEAIVNAKNSFDESILKEDIESARSALIDLQKAVDQFEDWANSKGIYFSYNKQRKDLSHYE